MGSVPVSARFFLRPLSDSPILVVIIGPGGVGKGSIVRSLVEGTSEWWLSRSWTTRQPRPTESGEEYVFVSRAEFEQAIVRGDFLEWAEFNGHLYGTPQPTAPDGRDVLLEIDLQGAQQVVAANAQAVVILVEPPSLSELQDRLRGRGDDDFHVAQRLHLASDEIAGGRLIAHHIVVNDDLARATDEIASIMENLRHSRRNSA